MFVHSVVGFKEYRHHLFLACCTRLRLLDIHGTITIMASPEVVYTLPMNDGLDFAFWIYPWHNNHHGITRGGVHPTTEPWNRLRLLDIHGTITIMH